MNLFDSVFADGMTVATYLFAALIALFCGALTAFASSYKNGISKSFFTTLILLPFAVQTVIIMVNGSIGTGIAVAGAFSLVRFRSVPGKARDILSVFIAMCAGLACATGCVAVALLFTVISCGIFAALSKVKTPDEQAMELRITVPENLNFTGAFDDLFERYTKKHKLTTVKNANMGSLYKLSYIIEMKDENDIREFIDDLRVRNGNLEIAIFRTEGEDRL